VGNIGAQKKKRGDLLTRDSISAKSYKKGTWKKKASKACTRNGMAKRIKLGGENRGRVEGKKGTFL